jgi:hypothetical protein
MNADGGEDAEPENRGVRAEAEGVSALVVLAALVATICGGAALGGAAYFLLHVREGQLRPSRVFAERTLPAPHRVAEVLEEPFDVAHPRPTLKERQRQSLHQFAWVDRARRLVRIPIDLAMDIAAGRSP